MKAFLTQFMLAPVLHNKLETVLFNAATRHVTGYMGGRWDSRKIGELCIPMLPGTDDNQQVTLINTMNQSEVTTDRVTASAALTALVCNHFWNYYTDYMGDDSNEAFSRFHETIRDTVYADAPAYNFDTNAYFAFTD